MGNEEEMALRIQCAILQSSPLTMLSAQWNQPHSGQSVKPHFSAAQVQVQWWLKPLQSLILLLA